MSAQKRSLGERLATGILWAAFFFAVGFAVANLAVVQNTLIAFNSGAYRERRATVRDPLDRQLKIWKKVPHALDGGAVLVGAEYSKSLALMLVDEDGKVLHRWQAENRLFNPGTLGWWKQVTTDEGFAIHDAALLPGGDVIFLQALMDVNNFRGQRLARMDKDSHILWEVPGNYHHMIDIAGDPERIFTISSRLAGNLPGAGRPLKGVAYMEDWIESFGMDGKKLGEWSVTDAFARSPYHNWVSSFELDPDMRESQRVNMPDGRTLYDLLHLNSVQYLDASRIASVPNAREGDLLLSFRGLDLIAAMRPSTGQIVWAMKGPWRHQHTVRAEPDGYIYLYDNEGRRFVTSYDERTPVEQKESRILRYRAGTGLIDEIYSGLDIYSAFLGYYHPLSGGNWLISSPQHAAIVVVSPEKKVIWTMRTFDSMELGQAPRAKQISSVHYYPAGYLPFLNAQGKTP